MRAQGARDMHEYVIDSYIYLRIERQERICKCCESGEVEDVEHLVMRCAHVKEERGKLMELMDERVEGWLSMEENERVAVAMDKACTDPAVGRAMERLWRKRFT